VADAFAPPLRDGVAASRVGVGDGRFASVLHFLAARFPAVADWPDRLARGDVLDDRGRPLAATSPCRLGDQLWYWRDPPPEAPVPGDLRLLHQDEHLVVVDKPHFLAAIPGGRHLRETALVRLRRQTGIATLAPMHRLDRETAGVLAFIVRPQDRHAYQQLLRGRGVDKVYEAVAPWRAALERPCVVRHRL
jgi:tRNA pseudouridine32 synthase / 23S rRNA pseudouridine746 synthase